MGKAFRKRAPIRQPPNRPNLKVGYSPVCYAAHSAADPGVRIKSVYAEGWAT